MNAGLVYSQSDAFHGEPKLLSGWGMRFPVISPNDVYRYARDVRPTRELLCF